MIVGKLEYLIVWLIPYPQKYAICDSFRQQRSQKSTGTQDYLDYSFPNAVLEKSCFLPVASNKFNVFKVK